MLIRNVEARVHGRYLHEDRGSERLLVGFHGYAENAEANFAELNSVGGAQSWSLVSIQALHPFYTRSGQVVANWMTSLDRELAMADNIDYVRRVLASLPHPRRLVFMGFSQGATMAARAAAHIGACAGLILLGGDIPPDVKSDPTLVLPPVLLGRGTKDEWYTEEKLAADAAFVQSKSQLTRCVFEGGHEWSDAFRDAASKFLGELT